MQSSSYMDIASLSVKNGNVGTLPPEIYEELWWYSGGHGGTLTVTTAGSAFIQKGSNVSVSSTSSSSIQLILLNSNLNPAQQYSFEAWLNPGSTSYTTYAALWDITSNSIISASQISANTSNPSLVRSGKFTLTPGHSFGITLWTSSSSNSPTLLDASLIIFPQ